MSSNLPQNILRFSTIKLRVTATTARSYLQAPIPSRARAWYVIRRHTHTGIINTCFSDHVRVRAYARIHAIVEKSFSRKPLEKCEIGRYTILQSVKNYQMKAQNIDITDTSNALMKFLVSHLSAISGGTSGFGGRSSRMEAYFARANPPETRNSKLETRNQKHFQTERKKP